MNCSAMRRVKKSISNNMNLENKIILVTGASSGIGKAIAVACAEKGATVLIHYYNNLAGAKETLKEVATHSNGFVFQADLTREKQIETMFKKIAREVGAIDMLVNNAGALIEGTFSDMETWRKTFDTDFFSTISVTQKFLAQKSKSTMRKIVNIGSVYGNLEGGSFDYIAYSSAKAALASMTVTLAKSDANLRVNAVAPGFTLTPMWDTTSAKEKKMCLEKTLIKRFVTPEEIAHATVMLLENDAMTGQVITVDGGLTLKNI